MVDFYLKPEADWLGGASPPSPKGRAERERKTEKQRGKEMKKEKFLISPVLPIVVLTVLLTTTLVLPLVKAVTTHGHYTIDEDGNYVYAVRCDHLVNPPGPNPGNAFTGCGINATYNDQHDGYCEIHYYYYRGFGGPDSSPYYWWCFGHSMTMMYQRDYTYTYQYSSSQPQWYSSGYEWPAWYHTGSIVAYPYNDAERVGARASSYFEATWYPYPQIYIASLINANDMIAGNVNEMNSTF